MRSIIGLKYLAQFSLYHSHDDSNLRRAGCKCAQAITINAAAGASLPEGLMCQGREAVLEKKVWSFSFFLDIRDMGKQASMGRLIKRRKQTPSPGGKDERVS